MAAYKGREYLKNYLALKRCRVLLRYKYYEMKNGIKYFRTIIPSELCGPQKLWAGAGRPWTPWRTGCPSGNSNMMTLT